MLGQSNTNTTASYIKVENEDITVTENGVYEASADYTGLGTVTVAVDYGINNQDKVITPSIAPKYVTADEGYTGLGTVTVNGVQNVYSENIKEGVVILGVEGSVRELNGTTIDITPTNTAKEFIPSSPYTGYTKVTVYGDVNLIPGNIVNGVTIFGVTGTAQSLNGEVLEVIPSQTAQSIIPVSPKNAFTQVNVSGDENLVSNNIVDGVSIFGVQGSATTLNGTTLNVTPTANAQTHTPSAPNNCYTEVIVNGDTNLVAENIANGVTIFGVTGNLESSETYSADLILKGIVDGLPQPTESTIVTQATTILENI